MNNLVTRGLGVGNLVTAGLGFTTTEVVVIAPLRGRHRGRRLPDEVFEKLPDGLEKGPPPPQPDFGETVHAPVDVFGGFEPSSANIVFKGLDNIEAIKARERVLKEALREEDDIEAIALILSELD